MSSLDTYLEAAGAWLRAHAEPRGASRELEWGRGPDGVFLFRDTSPEEERAGIEALKEWQRAKFDAGYGAISRPAEYGGAGLPRAYEDGFRRLEAGFVIPAVADLVSISLEIEAPTILTLGTEEQKQRWLRPLRRGDLLCCQLFSEPGAGSDLGSIALRAERDGEEWVLNGQKVWTSGAQYAELGIVICRTSRDAPRQQAFTAFVVPLDAPGITVLPLRQMTGGANFNEVFFDGARIPDSARLGEVGGGWSAMMTTLGFERAAAARGGGGGGPDLFGRLVMTARQFGRLEDPLVRQALADLYARNRMRSWTARRAAASARAKGVPGPEGSLSKLALTRSLQRAGEIATLLLGPAMVADTGEWGTYAWSELVCGTPGLRLGGGTDEIQKNTIAERALGLPREPRVGTAS
ncbi:acyl-CoA dehydrogenase family protein [Streptomyces sp. NPDC051018]|uniref:acyl-CoA dehydrogenase family protein n=1 Tax=Streptomyces sp. NPDC051018 TaxID=3365639 RepID=UPI0037B5214B